MVAATFVALVALPVFAQSSPIAGLVNTGRNQSVGQSDSNWTILETGTSGVVVSYAYPLANTTQSKWIWQATNGQPTTVTRTFRTTFTLNATEVATARIAGRWATDNFGDDILINGVSTGQTATVHEVWANFVVASGFVAGLNTIDFVVRDVGTVAAFRAEIVGYTGYEPAVMTDAVSRELAFAVDTVGQSSGSGGNSVVRDAVSRELAFAVDTVGQSSGSGGNSVVRDAVSREAAFVMVPPPCETQVLAPVTAAVGFRSGTNQCTLTTAGAYCAWSVVSEASWMTVSAPSSGNGTGATVNYVVAENQALTPRTGTLRAGNSTLTVTQAAAADCDSNGVGDPADIDAGLLSDCDGNRIPDGCDIAAGGVEDLDGNGVPDSCQTRDLVVEWTTTPPTNILPNLPTTISYRVRNIGNGPVHASWVENIRLSADATIGSDTDIAAFARVNEIIQPGAFVERSDTIIVPLDQVGTRRLVVALDTTNQVAEGATGEANNQAMHPSPIVVDACNSTNYLVAACEAATLNIPATPGDGANVEIFNGVGGGVPPTPAQIASRVPSGVMLTPYIDYPNPGVHVTIGQNLTNFFASTTVPPAQVASIAASNFILRITALLRIEREMDREPATPQIDISLGVGSDDGYHLTVGSTFLGSVGDRPFSYSWVDVDFETEGLYPVTLLFAANSVGYSGLEFAWNTALAGSQLIPQSVMYLAATDCDRKVEFEDLAVGSVVTGQYAVLGLQSRVLGGNVQVTNANPTKFVPVSGTKVLADPGASPADTGLVEFTFVVPGTENKATVDRFSLFVIDAESIGSLVRAFDSYGNEIFSEQVNAGGGTQTPVTIDRIGISRVVVSLGSGSDTSAIDNICFDRPTLDCYQNELTPSAASFAFAGGSGNATVTTAGATCPWSVESDVAWITFPSGAGGTGATGSFAYAVAANTGVAARVGTISAQDATLIVTQAGAPDCNGNGVGDPSEIAAGTTPDCNGNGVPDACDIAVGTASDADANGVPDSCQYADLVLVSVETVPSSPTATQAFELRWTVRNAGNWPVSGTRVDRFLLSADAQIGGDALLVESTRSETLAPGEEGSYSIAATAPLAQVGARRIVTALDAGDIVRETTAGNANNLSIDSAVTNIIAPPLPDLAVDMVTAPSSVQATVPFVVQYRVRNLGATPTAVPFLEEVFTSSDAVVGSDVLVKQTLQTAIVPAGAEIIRTASVVVAAAQEGAQRFVVRVDAGNAVGEFPIDDANTVAIGA
ncbi:MAG: CARDB domain-containing protein, partial [Limnohabitans sp.]|nr:CARDB domain-containing protein [Limnohabitans sp.]